MPSSPQFVPSPLREQIIESLEAALDAYYGLANNPVVQAEPVWLEQVHTRLADLEERLICLRNWRPAPVQLLAYANVRADASRPGPFALTPPPTSLDPDGLLTPRHRQVLALVVRGYSNARIARELVIEPGTAANHVAAILGRLRLHSRTELAVWALNHGFSIDPPLPDKTP
jgi:DNA-binding CsgD family transcriptional regulator